MAAESPESGTQRWVEVLEALYRNDGFVHYTHERISEDEWETFDWVPEKSDLVQAVSLTRDEVRFELKYLNRAGLADYVRPETDHDFVAYRVTKKGLEIIHDERSRAEEDRWRERRREWKRREQQWRDDQKSLQTELVRINTTLTAATVVLAGTAVVQALDAISLPAYFDTFVSVFAVVVLLGVATYASGLLDRYR